ncbi:MAG TPA: serine hydrolase domain-containing protein, partial [Thermomicrobiales bacterium]|nr:serine hydrolase domain-containing protein [Thermomicrobiales bacterium]
MTNSGFSKTRLARLHDTMAGYVERGEVPGIVTLVSRRDETHVDAIGTLSDDGSVPIQRDTIFRISSMTKPITAVAALILVEECRLRLDDPVDEFLPELVDRQVLARINGPIDDTVPANRPITLRDLLTFRLGYGMLMESPDEYPILRAVNELGIGGFGPPDPDSPHGYDEWMRRLATLPLLHQPGERWLYNTGSYVLGVLISRVTGQSLESFFRERIFEPLGMHDTSFSVPPDKLDRLPDCYWGTSDAGTLNLFDPASGSAYSRRPVFEDGSAGLVSTVDDYFAFSQMLLNNGKHGTERILSRPSIQAMTTNQLTPEQIATGGVLLGEGRGWGFGVGITLRRDGIAATPGRYGWDGGLGTTWYSDPAEELIGIMLCQRLGF